MNSINISGDRVFYNSDFHVSHKDFTWTLLLNDILVIGVVNRMDFDEDSDFIVFIDKKLNKYFINTTLEISNWDIVKKELESFYKIEFLTQINDNEKVLYPIELSCEHLYEWTLVDRIKKIGAFTHIADGKLSHKIRDYINGNRMIK